MGYPKFMFLDVSTISIQLRQLKDALDAGGCAVISDVVMPLLDLVTFVYALF